jgi:glyoxylase-like metal-dependent hydrolase (beta-lactamase superfamily II)
MLAEYIDLGLYRLMIPFEDLYTTVYLVISDEGCAVIDSGTYPSDVDKYILPALDELGISGDAVKLLLLTHDHGDHAGGIATLSGRFPEARACACFTKRVEFSPLADGDILLGRLQTVHLFGHTKNSVGYYDIETKTLLSGDCLQLGGVGKYTNGICYADLYCASVEKLRSMDILRIVAAHDYEPLGAIANGREEVKRYLDTCLKYVK